MSAGDGTDVDEATATPATGAVDVELDIAAVGPPRLAYGNALSIVAAGLRNSQKPPAPTANTASAVTANRVTPNHSSHARATSLKGRDGPGRLGKGSMRPPQTTAQARQRRFGGREAEPYRGNGFSQPGQLNGAGRRRLANGERCAIGLGHHAGTQHWRRRATRFPLGLNLEGYAQVCATMTFEAQTPNQVRTDIANAEAEHAVTTPLTHVGTLMTNQVGRALAAFANDDQRPQGDAIRALWHRAPHPQAVTVVSLKGHERNHSARIPTRTGILRRSEQSSSELLAIASRTWIVGAHELENVDVFLARLLVGLH